MSFKFYFPTRERKMRGMKCACPLGVRVGFGHAWWCPGGLCLAKSPNLGVWGSGYWVLF